MQRSLIIVCAVVLVVLCGCATKTNPPISGTPDPVASPQNNPNIELIHGNLARGLGFDSAIVGKDDGLLFVTIPMRNRSDGIYNLDYRIIWYDINGREVQPQMGWTEIALNGREQRRVTLNALDERAEEWKFQVKWANR
jgi:uncharacterized protein YcfL